MDVTQFALVVMKNVRDFVQPSLDELAKRMHDGLIGLRAEFDRKLAQVPEGKQGERGLPGEKGERGESGPAGEKGLAGEPGKDADDLAIIERLKPVVKEVTQNTINTNEILAEILKSVQTQTDSFLSSLEIPKPKDGQDGKSVTLDDVRPMIEAAQAKWELDFERRAQEVLQRAVDRMPKPMDGKDGAPGKDGENGMNGKDGEPGKDAVVDLSALADAYIGVWDNKPHGKGTLCTWGGSVFIAKRDTESKPESDDSWHLMVKRGRDGKDGSNGKDFTPRPVKS